MKDWIIHNEIGQITPMCDWIGENHRITLAKKVAYTKRGTRIRWYCLYGSPLREIVELTPVMCKTKTGKWRTMLSAIKMFNEMIKATEHVIFAN